MRLLALLFLGVLCLPASAGNPGELRNRLSGHPSPYLAMHGDDPVHWQEWDSQVLERARREGKPVYVSIGYFSCHWCHVMQRESYRDPAIAALLNRHFIPVKVDRELQPALDERLMEFVERTRGHAGWPLNVFLTPEGYPLLGLVYLPPDRFRSLLSELQERWQRERPELRRIARSAAEALSAGARSPGPNLPAGLAAELRQALVSAAKAHADIFEGGFGGPNKFPQVPQLLALLDALQRSPDPELEQFLRLTLDRMAQGGLRDHLRGGFFRYVVDPGWAVPHFEKMLYDNALLAELYLRAGVQLSEPRYREVAFDTLDFMLAEMVQPGGGLLASLSAVDGSGSEGGFYLWPDQELSALLSEEERALANLVWDVGGPPELDEGHHLRAAVPVAEAAARLGLAPETARAHLDQARRALLRAQDARSLPRDTKVLAAWNGLALRAFSLGAAEDPKYAAAARGIRNYLAGQLWDGQRLLRARARGAELGRAALEDYAYVAAGLWTWAELPGNDGDRTLVRQVLDQAWKRFHAPLGWRTSEHSLLPYGPYQPVLLDGPMPSPAATIIATSLEYARSADAAALHRQALTALNVDHAALRAEPFGFATHILTLSRAQEQ